VATAGRTCGGYRVRTCGETCFLGCLSPLDPYVIVLVLVGAACALSGSPSFWLIGLHLPPTERRPPTRRIAAKELGIPSICNQPTEKDSGAHQANHNLHLMREYQVSRDPPRIRVPSMLMGAADGNSGWQQRMIWEKSPN
jgi:hypothetical protein